MTSHSPVPLFHLYGEAEGYRDPAFVHIETIESRSSRNAWEIAPHRHSRLDQLLVVRSGGVMVRIDAESGRHKGPVACYVPAPTIHGFRFDEDVDGDVVTFTPDLCRAVMPPHGPHALLPGAPLIQPLSVAQTDAMTPLLDRLREEAGGHGPDRTAAAAWLVALLMLGLVRASSAADRSVETGRQHRFRALVDRHFTQQRPVAFYADALGVTERTLGRMCQAGFGCSPQAYLHRRLVLEADRLLIYGTATVAQVADALGFADPSYFTRFYRRMTGRVPSAARV